MVDPLKYLLTLLKGGNKDISEKNKIGSPKEKPPTTTEHATPNVLVAETGLATNLSLGLAHVRKVAEGRLQEYFGKGSIGMPDFQLYDDGSPLFEVVKKWGLSTDEYLTLMIALAPHLQPNFFESIISPFLPKGGDFPEFGGAKGTHQRGMIPTGDTVLFILRGMEIGGRLTVQQHILSNTNPLFKERVLFLEETKGNESMSGGRISVAPDRLRLWENTLPEIVPLSDEVSLQEMAQRFELSGASILNVLHISTLKALARKQNLTKSLLLEGIKKEYAKEGKTI